MNLHAQELLRNKYVLFPLERPDDIKEAKEYVASLQGKRHWELINAHPCFRHIITDEKIRQVVEAIYGAKGYHLTSYSSNTIVKDGPPSRWHTDHPYYEGLLPNDIMITPKLPLSIQVNIALDDFTTENGATKYLTQDGKEKQFLCPAGTVMMYCGDLWHCAGKNTTDRPRSVLLSNFVPPCVKAFKVNDAPDLYKQVHNGDDDFTVIHNRVFFRR